MSYRGQSSIEFMIVLGIVLVIFIIMGVIIQQKIVSSAEFKMEAQGRRVLYMVAENINEIASVGDGYHKCMTLPGEIYGGRSYRLLFYPDESTAFLETEDYIWSVPIATMNVSCNIAIPCYLDTTGEPIDVWISNYRGKVELAGHGSCNTDWIGVE
ncbi:MAG: hypothetical protein ABH834_06365 [Candidatus Altiarchaeota archaeon]